MYWNYIPKRFLTADFQSFKATTNAQQEALDYLKNADPLTQNVILYGTCGTGKTHLCYAFLKSKANADYQADDPFCPSKECFFLSLKDLLSEIKESFSLTQTGATNAPATTLPSKEESLYQKAISAPILIIDELGLQYGSKMERVELFRLFNERYNMMRPTVAVSNLSPKELQKSLGQRIYERLFSNAKVFFFNAPSYRNAYPIN